MIVDSHAHIFERGLPIAPGARHFPQYDAPLSDYLDLLDRSGVDHGVLTAPSFLGTGNAYLLRGLDSAHGRLRGTIIVAPDTARTELEELAARSVIGIRLNWYHHAHAHALDPGSSSYRTLFERCAGLDWHVEIYGEGPRLAGWLPPILDTGVRVVVDHFGSPDPRAGVDCQGFRCILRAFATSRLWVKLSAPYRVGFDLATQCAQVLLREGGPGRLVWGSDWPWTQNEEGRSYDACLGWLHAWVPDAAARDRILGQTACSLFGFDQGRV